MSRRSAWPVVRNADDVARLAQPTASCVMCKHVILDACGTAYMRCSAYGGRYTEYVNKNGDCVKWEPPDDPADTAPPVSTPAWKTSMLVAASVVAISAAVMGLVALGLMLFEGDGRCRATAKEVSVWSSTRAQCDHPDHILSIEGDIVLCECPATLPTDASESPESPGN